MEDMYTADPDQKKIDDLLQWQKVYDWAKQHKRAPFLDTTLYSHVTAIGRSNNQCVCPLACYLNEAWPVPGNWEVNELAEVMRTSYDEPAEPWEEEQIGTDRYDLPGWAKKAMHKVDEIKGDREEGNGDAWKQAWISQEDFLKILEEVKP